MHPIDYALIIVYLGLLLYLGLIKRLRGDSTTGKLILGGRMLTLPAFVASLVSTWYGGILGVGEYSYQYGLSNWLVFGLPYYLAAALFALFLAKKARRSEVLTIPERLAQAYGNRTAAVGSAIIYLMTVPAAYILMIGVLTEHLFGWPFWVGVLAGTFFSVIYVYTGGFDSVVRTDLLQFGLMFVGFALLIGFAWAQYGGIDYLTAHTPAAMFTWNGGNSSLYVLSWYVIALATLIEPAFYQRCYAAKTESVARNGIYISIACWAIFDFLTTFSGIYARAILPDLTDPVASYPALALHLLPTGLTGLFALALLATVMSTIDSYSFIAASTFGHDIVGRAVGATDAQIFRWTKIGLILSAGLAVVIAVFFRSVVDIWYAFGSVGTPALLVPVFTSFAGRRRLPSHWALLSIVGAGMVSAVWLGAKYFRADETYWYGVPPIVPGLLLSLIIFGLFSKKNRPALPATAK